MPHRVDQIGTQVFVLGVIHLDLEPTHLEPTKQAKSRTTRGLDRLHRFHLTMLCDSTDQDLECLDVANTALKIKHVYFSYDLHLQILSIINMTFFKDHINTLWKMFIFSWIAKKLTVSLPAWDSVTCISYAYLRKSWKKKYATKHSQRRVVIKWKFTLSLCQNLHFVVQTLGHSSGFWFFSDFGWLFGKFIPTTCIPTTSSTEVWTAACSHYENLISISNHCNEARVA